MPITEFQRIILKLIAQSRSPQSHLAGGVAVNQADDSPRYSQDIDIFHDSQEQALLAAEADGALLTANGYKVEWLIKQPGFCRAIVSKGLDSVKAEWVYDSAFRFFPAVPDPDLGFRLHPADVAVNKVLAAASRREPRDLVDALYLHRSFLHLGALIWAAPGKDPGFSPESIIELLDRHKAISPLELDQLQLVRPLDAQAIRKEWNRIKEESISLIQSLPAEDVGCLYLNKRTGAVSEPTASDLSGLVRHFGSLYGAWPKFT